MAITKIHPIKVNLKAALDYIENPDKTDDKMLVSSFGCSYETADIEFQMLLAQAFNKGNNLAHHLIQAFEPGETTPEQAHEIGRQLADEVLQGKYPYVLTTHIDKGHLHNHIIFCAVDMLDDFLPVLKLPDFLLAFLNLGGQFLAGFLSRFRHGWSLLSARRHKKSSRFQIENSCSRLVYSVI